MQAPKSELDGGWTVLYSCEGLATDMFRQHSRGSGYLMSTVVQTHEVVRGRGRHRVTRDICEYAGTGNILFSGGVAGPSCCVSLRCGLYPDTIGLKLSKGEDLYVDMMVLRQRLELESG